VACVAELWGDLVSIAPVDGCLGSAAEEMSGVSCEGNRSDSAQDLGLRLNEEILHANLGNGTIPGTDDDIIVSNDVDGVDTLREESLDGTEALEKGAVKRDLNDITSLSTKIGKGVSGIDGDASENTLDLAHVHILELNLLVNQISGPEAEAIIVDSDKSGV